MLIVFALCGLNSLVDLKNGAKSRFITKFQEKLDFFSILLMICTHTFVDFAAYLLRQIFLAYLPK